jgi:GNAT superfamily N-acetyltransferase
MDGDLRLRDGGARTQSVIRVATTDEAATLAAVQREASLAGFGHIFAPELHPYPDDAILERWRTFPGSILVAERDGRVVGVAAVEAEWLHGFYVLPELWGTGVADELHAAALDRGVVTLWCLAENHRARRFYEKRGWRENGRTRVVEYPPHPIDVGYSRKA